MKTKKERLLSDIISMKNLRCLELSVSETCNYRCTYCTFWRNFQGSKKSSLIDLDLAKKATLDFLKVTSNKDDALIYFGTAEPLLNFETVRDVILLVRRIKPNIALNLITNGGLLDEKKLIFFRENRINLGISLDGKEKLQKNQRVSLNNTVNSFKVVMNSLKMAKKIGFNFSCLSGTYRTMDIEDHINFLISLCKEYSIKELDIDFDANSLSAIDDPEKLAEIMVNGYLLARKNGLNVFGYWMIPYLNTINYNIVNKNFCGNSIGESICISSAGEFKLCGYDNSYITKYTSFTDLFKTRKVREVYKRLIFQKRSICSECNIRDVCCGQCMLIKKTGRIFKLTCEFYKVATKKLLEASV